jgi:uncharacterized Zn-finger protein
MRERNLLNVDFVRKGFPQKGNLKRHIESVHEGKKPYKCKLYEESLSVKRHLKKHIESVHDGKKPLKCEFCKDSFF